jgi:hypothetical protein
VAKDYQKFDEIRALDRFHVALGEIKGRGRNRRQKRVDVRLAVDMLMHTFRGNMDNATLLAGDVDFIPLIEALVREGMNITIWHPPQASTELLGAADSRQPFNLATCANLLTRDGAAPAFFDAGARSSGGQPDLAASAVRFDVQQDSFAVAWENETLSVWECHQTRYTLTHLRAPGSTRAQALQVWDAKHRTSIAKTAEHVLVAMGR